jgi:hypothetical protein
VQELQQQQRQQGSQLREESVIVFFYFCGSSMDTAAEIDPAALLDHQGPVQRHLAHEFFFASTWRTIALLVQLLLVCLPLQLGEGSSYTYSSGSALISGFYR